MMDSPFYRNQVRSVPVQRNPSPKFVSIPVRFISLEISRKESAIKIQKVFRGFLVRKSVKKISSIRKEVDEIERRFSSSEVVELIRRDPKERLRVNETLMSLLFKLDSIRGVDSGVRDFRKAVIKKAIALQEKVDSIVASGCCQTLDTANNNDSRRVDESVDQALKIDDSGDCLTLDDQVKISEAALDHGSDNVSSDCRSSSEAVTINDSGKTEFSEEGNEFEGDYEQKAEEDYCVVKEIDENCNAIEAVGECAEESVETSPGLGLIESGEENKVGASMEVDKNGVEDEERDDNKRNRELLEKVTVENEKMMSLMKQIFERNEMMTKMLNSLSQRVEQLEKAFICDKLRRKKKRHAA